MDRQPEQPPPPGTQPGSASPSPPGRRHPLVSLHKGSPAVGPHDDKQPGKHSQRCGVACHNTHPARTLLVLGERSPPRPEAPGNQPQAPPSASESSTSRGSGNPGRTTQRRHKGSGDKLALGPQSTQRAGTCMLSLSRETAATMKEKPVAPRVPKVTAKKTRKRSKIAYQTQNQENQDFSEKGEPTDTGPR